MNSVLQIVFILPISPHLLGSATGIQNTCCRDSSIKRLHRKGRDLAWVGIRTAKGGGFIVCDGQSL
ncbi:hypothetical protein ERO13_A06G077400v2 [Gossypium hirsutum]|uniref:Secreted protein n=4 Tax=Gossypium TaxID=3633 RepID=A0A5J5VBN5_GOSBA|nr:hypothetical protein ES319_A06G084700v1 [Gossypium barbadense]KAG4194871.1 hypothetical protein ERO13_A06G077400v2 [Gossypium hirsutum]TYH12792.1 hypothetical protein ES288_A06G094500v1 [Gossypium darwinii]TYI22279.1 hypothetical protein ES332_A06G092100v1 [Gossypium tomentosum]TYJ29687.1 hypothetical protein E1A91_A06G084000v1 [Gossypium mustelinum]